MTKKTYESPKFDFREIKLLERIAENCWGLGYAFIDHDRDPATPTEKYWFAPGGKGCQGGQDAERLAALKAKFPCLAEAVSEADVSVNTKSSDFITFVRPGHS